MIAKPLRVGYSPLNVFLSALAIVSLLGGAAKADEEKIPVLTDTVQEIKGPKRVVSVGKFDAIGSFEQQYGDWDIGGGISAMMTTALVESERFIVLERANMGQVLAEQQMKGQGVTSATTGPALGQVTGTNFLIYGSVTEFGAADSGGGMSLGLSGGSLGKMLGVGLSRQTASGKVAMDIRLVNATTSQVEEVYRVSEQIDNSSWDINVGYEGVSLGTNQFLKTPLGEATRKCITKAVQQIAAKTDNLPWTGQVVDFDGGEVYINAGAETGLKMNDKFRVERILKKLTDPATGELLMLRKKELGLVTVTEVLPKISLGNFAPLDADAPQRGDLVVTISQ
ncbi:CsgG/HfaB family protein [Sneathiella sp.]|jgi:curli biogenesis system outer membrane secretion channel CsgG|uniref:CsgG/HfaB family protein n=1 Tax=Sneathiella sp. TaxID=1964365 RepID=UPI0039E30815